MTEEAVHPLLGAATNLEFDTMAQLVKAGQRCYDAFLRDQGYTLSNDNPDYAEFLALASERCGLPVENESQLLFEIYETLLLAGHPLPCDGTRRCMVRVIAGADASRHTRATILMGLCLDQGLLDWRNSQWAIDIEQQAGAKLMTPLSRPDELFADAFGEAAQAGNLPLLQRLAGSLPENLNARRQMLTSTQSAAAKCMRGGNTACLDYLLTLMPEPMWRRTSSMGSNPLTIVAAQTGQEELLRWLVVDKGMDINELDAQQEANILVRALDAHQSRMVPILLALGADPNTCQKGHPNPLNMAAWHNKIQATRELIAAKTDVNYQDSACMSPTLIASMAGHTDILAMLLDAGGDIEMRDKQGRTPASWAARNDRIEAFVLLMAHGANMEAVDNEGNTPRQVAKGKTLAMLEAQELERHTEAAKGMSTPRARV